MNILITGKAGTGKTHLVELLAKPLRSLDHKVLLVDDSRWSTKPLLVEIPALEECKGNSDQHLFVITQSAAYLYPNWAGKFDVCVHLDSREMGEWLWKIKGVI